MEQFSPMIVLAIIWLCIGLPLSKAAQAKKRNAAARSAAARAAAPKPTQAPAQAQAPVRAQGPVWESSAQDRRMMPTISVTVNDDSVYQGSMNAYTDEGYDPCHEGDLKGLNRAESAPPAQPAGDTRALPFGWTGSDIVRGIVVSEILNRRKTSRAS